MNKQKNLKNTFKKAWFHHHTEIKQRVFTKIRKRTKKLSNVTKSHETSKTVWHIMTTFISRFTHIGDIFDLNLKDMQTICRTLLKNDCSSKY